MGLERIYSDQTQGTRRQKIYAVNPVRIILHRILNIRRRRLFFLKTTFYSTDFNDSTISICAVNLHTISWIKREQPTTINETIIYDINRNEVNMKSWLLRLF